jgi:hypothetical protein
MVSLWTRRQGRARPLGAEVSALGARCSALAAKCSADTLKCSALRASGCAETLTGCALRASGSADTLTGYALRARGCADTWTGSPLRASGYADTLTGCALPASGSAQLVEPSALPLVPTVLPLAPTADTLAWRPYRLAPGEHSSAFFPPAPARWAGPFTVNSHRTRRNGALEAGGPGPRWWTGELLAVKGSVCPRAWRARGRTCREADGRPCGPGRSCQRRACRRFTYREIPSLSSSRVRGSGAFSNRARWTSSEV